MHGPRQRELRVYSERWPLSRPFRISRGVTTAAEVIVVEIVLADGVSVGRGEAVPYVRYGETTASVMSQLEGLGPLLASSFTREDLLRHLAAGAARNAVDCALWDLQGQAAIAGVAGILGESTLEPVATALTIGLDAPAAMAEAARAIASAALIKIKVDGSDPAMQIRAVREVCPDSELIVDPNESWTANILRDMQPILAENRVALLEQPLPAGHESKIKGFIPSIPICADESCHTAADLPRLVGHFQFVNIKLDKTGGLTAALELLRRARADGFGIMVGCMICTSLSIAPALHVARHARFVDVDGPLWLSRDRAGGIQLSNQWVMPPQPGFWGDLRDRDFWGSGQ
jgi:L-alanine-DL-glutamate epimerase-like enolase superfamily enzyme